MPMSLFRSQYLTNDASFIGRAYACFDILYAQPGFFGRIGVWFDADCFVVEHQCRRVIITKVIIEIAEVEAAAGEQIFHIFQVGFDFARVVAGRKQDEEVFVVADRTASRALVVFIALHEIGVGLC